MALPFSEDLLSAYLDGETTPEETAIVERQLEEQPELQAQLDKLADLSQTLQHLPRTPAPQDLVQSVLSELNQRRPAPTNTSTTKPVQESRSPRFWVSGFLAASVLVVIGLFSLQSRFANGPLEMAATSDSSSHPAPEAVSFTEGSAEFADLTVEESEASASDSAVATNLSVARNMAANESKLIAAAPRVMTLDKKTIAERLSSLSESPATGDEISILTTNGETPILVDFTVVDAQKTLGQLQVLLKNHSVQPVVVEQGTNDLSNTAKFDSNEKLVAVYLDLDEPDLEQVLNQVTALEAVVFLSDEVEVSESVDQPSTQSHSNSLKSNSTEPGSPFTLENQTAAQNQTAARRGVKSTSAGEKKEAFRAKLQSVEQHFRFDFSAVRNNTYASDSSDVTETEIAPAESALAGKPIPAMKANPPPPTPSLPVRVSDDVPNRSQSIVRNPPSPSDGVSVPTSSPPKASPSPQAPLPGKPSMRKRSNYSPGNRKKEQKQSPERIRALLLLREESE